MAPRGGAKATGKGWYILVGIVTLLIVILIGFAVYMTYEGSDRLCADGVPTCSLPE